MTVQWEFFETKIYTGFGWQGAELIEHGLFSSDTCLRPLPREWKGESLVAAMKTLCLYIRLCTYLVLIVALGFGQSPKFHFTEAEAQGDGWLIQGHTLLCVGFLMLRMKCGWTFISGLVSYQTLQVCYSHVAFGIVMVVNVDLWNGTLSFTISPGFHSLGPHTRTQGPSDTSGGVPPPSQIRLFTRR